jgi:hypothetical protein
LAVLGWYLARLTALACLSHWKYLPVSIVVFGDFVAVFVWIFVCFVVSITLTHWHSNN